VLRYADTQKSCTLSGFKPRMMAAIQAMEVQLGIGTRQFDRFLSKVTRRVDNMERNTLMVAGIDTTTKFHCYMLYCHKF